MILTIKIVSKYREEVEIQISKVHKTIDVHVAVELLRIITGGARDKRKNVTRKACILSGTFGKP